ncbi:alpha/beta hydrolase [Microbacterium sp. NPDC019599]|uniref:alpha/beta hydrolase n=1 Tax=Microbacterium sp. NPDC019599 TaxID=3154690 RepID=UPI0033DC9D41
MIWVAYVFTALALLLAVGTIAWQTPWIGLIGSLGGYLPGWLLGFAAAGGIAGTAAWMIDPSAGALVAVVLCLLTIPVGIKVIVDQSGALGSLGVKVRAVDFFGPYGRAKAGPDEVVTYGPVDGHSPRMGIYKPTPSDNPAHVVVHIHGGGWAAGDESSDSRMLRQLTERGYLVFTPSYTYATEDSPTWDLAPRQIARALAEVKALAPQYGGSADRVYLMGSSAGGHLAPLVANRLAAGDTLGQDAEALPSVAAMSLLIPAVDPAMAEGNRYVPAGATGRRLVRGLVGGAMEEFPERYAAIDATGHLSDASPPALLIYGPNDWLVPAQGPIAYALRSRQLGVEVKTVPIPWTGHLMGLNGAAGRAADQLTAEWFAAH